MTENNAPNQGVETSGVSAEASEDKEAIAVETLVTGAEFADPSNRAIRLAFQWSTVAFDNNSYTVAHRTNNTPADAFYHLHTSKGRPTHLAASGPTLYLLFESRSVLSLTYNLDREVDVPSPLPILRDRKLPSLPTKGRVLGWCAIESGPVVLMANDAFSSSPDAAPLELFSLKHNRWQSIELPPGLEANQVRVLAPLQPRLNRFGILTEQPGGSSSNLHLFAEDQWTTQSLNLPPATYTQATSVQDIGYLLLQESNTPDQLNAYRLRNGVVHKIGSFEGTQSMSQFWIAPNVHGLAAFVINHDQQMAWASIDFTTPATATTPATLTTPSTSTPQMGASSFTTITQQPPPVPRVDPMTILVLIAVIIGMVFLFATTRSDPSENTPALPEGVTLADHPRALAGLLDIGVAVATTVWLFDLNDVMVIFRYWPIVEPEFERSLPAVTAIGLFVAHTTLTEVFTARTLGKFIFRCKVTNLTGQPPHLWQVLARNLFKALELAVPYLLILPMISPFHQRLGDLVAKTVVTNNPNPGVKKTPGVKSNPNPGVKSTPDIKTDTDHNKDSTEDSDDPSAN